MTLIVRYEGAIPFRMDLIVNVGEINLNEQKIYGCEEANEGFIG